MSFMGFLSRVDVGLADRIHGV
jgi:hypothetical protein